MEKVLNLYAGIGGNRKLWTDVDITAVEINPDIAQVYRDYFPDDKVIVGDAHEYLLNHFAEFDFIWSSQPCQTHSAIRQHLGVQCRETIKPVYPDMTLYQEIIFLRANAKSKWVVENVKPYYEPLIRGQLIRRHLFWSNFQIYKAKFEKDNIEFMSIKNQQKKLNYDLSKYKIPNKRQILRNCVNSELGLHILNESRERTIL